MKRNFVNTHIFTTKPLSLKTVPPSSKSTNFKNFWTNSLLLSSNLIMFPNKIMIHEEISINHQSNACQLMKSSPNTVIRMVSRRFFPLLSLFISPLTPCKEYHLTMISSKPQKYFFRHHFQ